MTLRNITIPKAVVSVGDEVFVVSGITANQVFNLYRRHREDLSTLFDTLAGRGTIEASDVLNSVEGIIAMFPDLVAEVIAMASGDKPEDGDGWLEALTMAAALPFPIQTEALLKIGELTFSPEMPPKKFFALLVGMIQRMNATTKTSPVGSDN